MNPRIQRIREFIQYDLWRQSHIGVHAPKKRLLYRILQTLILVGRVFNDQVLVVRANSLTFALLFAFIPMMALIYAVARGFGFEELVSQQLTGSFLAEANIAPILLEWVERYLATARDGLFVGIGLVVLIWAVYAFFNMLERSFNTIWNVKQSRSFGRRLTNYMVVLLLVPIMIILTSGISIFLNSTAALSPVLQAIEPIRRLLLRLVPFVVASAVFTWIFIAIQNTGMYHTCTPNPQGKAAGITVPGHGALLIFHRQDRHTGGNHADHRNLTRPDTGDNGTFPALGTGGQQKSLLLKLLNVVTDGGSRAQAHSRTDLTDRRRITVFLYKSVNIIQYHFRFIAGSGHNDSSLRVVFIYYSTKVKGFRDKLTNFQEHHNLFRRCRSVPGEGDHPLMLQALTCGILSCKIGRKRGGN